MNYKGFNIAVHEMGHNVEQTFSLNDIDYTLLQGVPNTAFTEALAFVFQAHDLEAAGPFEARRENARRESAERFLGDLRDRGRRPRRHGRVALDVRPSGCRPRAAQGGNTPDLPRHLEQVLCAGLRKKDVVLLGVYSHMIDSLLYLPDYPIGHLIAFQIEQQMEKAGNLGSEFERMAKAGNIAPDIWMKKATGAPVGPQALLAATEKALIQANK